MEILYWHLNNCYPTQKIYAVHWVRLDHYSSTEKAYQDGMEKLEDLTSKVFNIEP